MSDPADLELVRTILSDTGVERVPEPLGWGAYFANLLDVLFEWLGGFVPKSLRMGGAFPVVGAVIAGVVLVGVAVALVVHFRRLAAGRTGLGLGRPHRHVDRTTILVPELDSAGWRAELERRLAAGDVRPALEAAWWWFARSIASGPIDPAWTSRELLVRCDRPQLFPIAGRLDVLIYGAGEPTESDVRRLVDTVQEAIA